MTDTKIELKRMAINLIQFLEGEVSPKEYFGSDNYEDLSPATSLLDNALDLSFKISREKQLLDFEIIVALGGPNIWCDSTFVYASWGGERVEMSYTDEIGLFETMQELYDTTINP